MVNRFFVDNSFKDFNTAAMRSADTEQDEVLTAAFEYKHDGFECVMSVNWRNENNNVTTDYNMFAYSGNRTFGGFMDAHIETCGLTAFKPGETAAVVAYDPPNDLVTIMSIVIVVRTPDVGTLPIPVTMDTRCYPLTDNHYTFSKRTVTHGKRKMLEINMELTKPVANLVTFAIYKLPDGATINMTTGGGGGSGHGDAPLTAKTTVMSG